MSAPSSSQAPTVVLPSIPASAAPAGVPVLDLSLPLADVAAAMKVACHEYGFFYVTHAGLNFDSALLASVFQASAQLFHLTQEQKQTFYSNAATRGWTPMGEEYHDGNKKADTKEAYVIGKEAAPGTPEALLPERGPNNWPAEDLLPGLNFRSLMEKYYAAITTAAHQVLTVLEASLDLPAGTWTKTPGCFDDPRGVFRLLHYAPQISDAKEGIFGTGAHTDFGMLTLLATDANAGLEVFDKKKQAWIGIPPIKDAFIVNLGDMVPIWTNDLYKSTLHRVMIKETNHRYSIPFFFDPNFSCVVSPLPSCVAASNPPTAHYAPTTAGKHLLKKIADSSLAYQSYHGKHKEEEKETTAN